MHSLAAKALLLFSASSALAWYTPLAGTTWEIILIETLEDVGIENLPPVEVIDADLEDNDAEVWQQAKDAGYKTVCYFSAGSYEDFRDDEQKFPDSVKGAPLDPPFEEELWLDIRAQKVRDIMKERMDTAVAKGCDAIDPDNLDAYANDGGGFGLTQQDSINYIRFLAQEAHNRNLGIGLKNAVDIVGDVLDVVDFQVNEQCQEFNCPDCNPPYYECSLLQPFIADNKAVFRIEYNETRPSQSRINSVCNWQYAAGFSTLLKKLDLDTTTWKNCDL